MIINLMFFKAKKVNQFSTWNFIFTLHLVQIDIKHLFLDRIQGCFDALEKRYVRMFSILHHDQRLIFYLLKKEKRF